MATSKCDCGDKAEGSCAACRTEDIFSYWCDTCKRSVAEKRCPLCGLKTQRKRATEPG